MRASSDYILGTDRRRFKIVGIMGVSNYPLDHLVLRARLLLSPSKAGHKYNMGSLLAQEGMVHGGRRETRR